MNTSWNFSAKPRKQLVIISGRGKLNFEGFIRQILDALSCSKMSECTQIVVLKPLRNNVKLIIRFCFGIQRSKCSLNWSKMNYYFTNVLKCCRKCRCCWEFWINSFERKPLQMYPIWEKEMASWIMNLFLDFAKAPIRSAQYLEYSNWLGISLNDCFKRVLVFFIHFFMNHLDWKSFPYRTFPILF